MGKSKNYYILMMPFGGMKVMIPMDNVENCLLYTSQIELRQRITKMRKVLSNYVVNEEYEEAAKLRDEIKALEKELSSEVG